MRAFGAGVLIPIAVIELLAWLPASWFGLSLAAAYVVAGNEPPATLMAGFFLVPITFLGCPIYALTPNARAHPTRGLVVLMLPLISFGLVVVKELPFLLTHGHL